jgi:hypothetical protein
LAGQPSVAQAGAVNRGDALLSCGNTSTAHLREILREHLIEALTLIRAGEPLVEIGDPNR